MRKEFSTGSLACLAGGIVFARVRILAEKLQFLIPHMASQFLCPNFARTNNPASYAGYRQLGLPLHTNMAYTSFSCYTNVDELMSHEDALCFV